MPLPKHENKHSYTAELPSGRKVKFRPWIVREEQEYMYATEGLDNKDEMIPHIEELIGKCLEEDLNLNDLSEIDFLALCVELRKKSKGEQHEIVFTCPSCQAVNDEIFISLVDDVFSEGMKDRQVEVAGVEYTFKDISRADVEKLKKFESEKEKTFMYMVYSLAAVATEDQTYTNFSIAETKKYFEEEISAIDFKKLSKEFGNILPVFGIRRIIPCEKCKKETHVYVDKVTDFFV